MKTQSTMEQLNREFIRDIVRMVVFSTVIAVGLVLVAAFVVSSAFGMGACERVGYVAQLQE